MTIPLAEVLLVEDNPGDVDLTIEAFNQGTVHPHINVVDNGEEALAFLYQQGQYVNAPRPDLILMDLNLPGKDGREVLGSIKADAMLRTIPVIILTTSEAQQDILDSYNLYANCYIVKPMVLEQFFRVVRYVEEFWFGIVRLPSL